MEPFVGRFNLKSTVRFFCLFVCLTTPFDDLAEARQAGEQLPSSKDEKKTTQQKNPAIKTDWGPEIEGMSIRIDSTAKTKWGTAETPLFAIQIRNRGKLPREFSFASANLVLTLNDHQYRWNTPDVRRVSALGNGETRDNFFLIQLDGRQWLKLHATEKSGALKKGKLEVLSVGKNEFEVSLEITDVAERPVVLSTAKVEFEMTGNYIELPTLDGVVLNAANQPVEKSEVYVCYEGQFYVNYSGFDGKKFNSKTVNHYGSFGGFSKMVKPVLTDKDGRFSIDPRPGNLRIVVIPPGGTAQVFSLADFLDARKLQLPEPSRLVIEYDIPGDDPSINMNLSLVAHSSPFVVPNGGRQGFVLRESFGLALENGSTIEVNGLKKAGYQLSLRKSFKVGRRSYSIGGFSRLLDLKSQPKTEFRMVRSQGQAISFVVRRIPKDCEYLLAGVFALNQSLNLDMAYTNRGLWTDVAIGVKEKAEFNTAMLSPGEYRIVVMSVPSGERPNSYNYKADFVGSRIIEVKDGGLRKAGDIKLIDRISWRSSSGMAMDFKLVDGTGVGVANQQVWPVNSGYQLGFESIGMRSNVKGICQSIKSAGKYRFVAGADNDRATFFEVQVPSMTTQMVPVKNPLDWGLDEEKKSSLMISSRWTKQKNESFNVIIENKSEVSVEAAFGDVQLIVNDRTKGVTHLVRCFPARTHEIYGASIEKKSTREFQFQWRDLLQNGLWTGIGKSLKDFRNVKVAGDSPIAIIKVGPLATVPFQVPKLPIVSGSTFR